MVRQTIVFLYLCVAAVLAIAAASTTSAQTPVLPVDQTLIPFASGGNQSLGTLLAGDRDLMVMGGPDEHIYYRWFPGGQWAVISQSVPAASLSMRGQRVGRDNAGSGDVVVMSFDGVNLEWAGFAEHHLGGEAVAVSADRIAVGIPGGVGPSFQPGEVRIWRHFGGENWVLEKTLVSPDGNERYGAALDFTDESGEILWIGAPGNGSGGTGRVERQVWTGSDWVAFGEIEEPLQQADNAFGAALAADKERLIVGAPDYDRLLPLQQGDAGAVFIYRSGSLGAIELEGLFIGDTSADHLGTAVDILESAAIAGAPGKDFDIPSELSPGGDASASSLGLILQAGEAEVYWRTGAHLWQTVARLRHPTPSTNDAAGTSVALVGRTALVGAPGLDGSGGNLQRGGVLTYLGTNAIFIDGFETGDTTQW